MASSIWEYFLKKFEIFFSKINKSNNEIVVEALKYDDEGGLVPMDAGTTNLVDENGLVDGTAANNVFGKTTLQMITLYFNYKFNSYF